MSAERKPERVGVVVGTMDADILRATPDELSDALCGRRVIVLDIETRLGRLVADMLGVYR